MGSVSDAGQAMEDLQNLGLDVVLQESFAAGKPIMGICLGTQIIFTSSEENNNTRCLGLLPGVVKKFPEYPKNCTKKCHMHSYSPECLGIPLCV